MEMPIKRNTEIMDRYFIQSASGYFFEISGVNPWGMWEARPVGGQYWKGLWPSDLDPVCLIICKQKIKNETL